MKQICNTENVWWLLNLFWYDLSDLCYQIYQKSQIFKLLFKISLYYSLLLKTFLFRCIKAVVSDSAFSVPPQQLITNDGGIIEIGAEVQYGITDVVVMVREVADHQDILRSLGKTVLVRLLAKKHVRVSVCFKEIQYRNWMSDSPCLNLAIDKRNMIIKTD